MKIYLAIPYTHSSKEVMEQRFTLVSKIAADLISQGLHVFSPVTNGHTLGKFNTLRHDFYFWQDYCLSLLDWADELWMIKADGWEKA